MEGVHIDNLKKVYYNFTLGPINMEAEAGYIVAVVGKNGCGKSTLFNCMLGAEIYDGACEWIGKPPEAEGNAEAVRKRFAYVLERCPFPKDYTLKEVEMCYSGFYEGFDREKYYKLCSQYGIPFNKPLRKLSRGSIMIVQIAFAFAYPSEVLFLDEPTAHLDSYGRHELYSLISEYASDGRMVFWSSHRMEELDRMADYVLGIKEGRQIFFCTKEELGSRYNVVKGSKRQLDYLSRALVGRTDGTSGSQGLLDTCKDHLKLEVYEEPAGLADIVEYLL